MGKQLNRCLSRRLKLYLAMAYHSMTRTPTTQCHLMFPMQQNGFFSIEKFSNKVESQIFEKVVTGPIKGESKYVHGKLKTWKHHIKTNFHSQDVPYMYCNATAVLKIEAVYKQSKNYHQQVYVEECKHNDAGERQCNILSDNGDNRSFEVLKRTQKKTF